MAGASAGLAINEVTKHFGKTVAVDTALFDSAPGEVIALTGPSGAGKSTLCRLIAGFEQPNGGSIELGGRDITDLAPGVRGIAYMFESYALYPHMTVYENAASPLKAPAAKTRLTDARIRERVQASLEFLEIGQLAERLPSQLSGGQRQRAALARALSQTPTALLLDEPISHLDAKLRHRLRAEIKRRLNEGSAPVIWCTPDGLEALSVGDRVVVIIDGRIEQIGSPDDIWLTPRTTRVARLIGDPPMNLLSGTVSGQNGGAAVKVAGVGIPLDAAASARVKPGMPVTIGVRADALDLAPVGEAGTIDAEIYAVEPFGKWAIVTARLAGELVKLKVHDLPHLAPGAAVGLRVRNAEWRLFDGATGVALPEN
jgi:ABC-type sugar transport system ATPase subunit